MNMKSTGGFTLVELIVVIAILAILAGVAVPAYSGYISRANDAAITSELSAIQTAAQATCAMDGTSVKTIVIDTEGKIVVTDDADQDVTISSDFYKTNPKLGEMIQKHSTYSANGATWSNGEWAPTT